jgi:hypothetical protein
MSNSARHRSQPARAARTARPADAGTRRPADARRPSATDVPGVAAATAAGAPSAEAGEEGAPPAPWHFKVLLFGTVGYLIYRFIWFIFWLTGHAWHG